MYFLLILAALLAPIAGAVEIDMSVTHLKTAYDTDFPQLLLSDLGTKKHFSMITPAGGIICCSVHNSTEKLPTAGADDELCLPASYGFAWDDMTVNKRVYCRSDTGSDLTTGIFRVNVW